MVDPNRDLRFWNAEKGVDVDAGDGADEEVTLSWFRDSRGKRYRDRIGVSCLLAAGLLALEMAGIPQGKRALDLRSCSRLAALSLESSDSLLSPLRTHPMNDG